MKSLKIQNKKRGKVMKKIFEQGDFSRYRITDLRESRSAINESIMHSEHISTVFLSHKHDDLEELKDIIGFLQGKYNVKVYIDSRDPSMPMRTTDKTAENIKKRIEQCDKFILLATDGAINSKWCNWELGYGDAHRFQDNIALFPIKSKGSYDSAYRGNEYMAIYPYINYYDGSEQYKDESPIAQGYYVCTEKNGLKLLEPLSSWFNNK